MYLSGSESGGRVRLAGVTSFGTVRCDSSVPGVYTRVDRYRKWVASVVARGQ